MNPFLERDDSSTMTAQQARDHLEELGQSQTEIASLFKVTPRSVRSWVAEDGTPVPQPVAVALHLARRLRRHGLWWAPRRRRAARLQPLLSQERQADARRRVYDLRVPEILARIGARGGPVAPWDVDLQRGRAQLGTMRLEFMLLPQGGFVPLAYERTDTDALAARDAGLLEDGYACIARALERAGRSALPPKCLNRARLVGDFVVLWDERPAPELVVHIAKADVLTLINHPRANDIDVLRFVDSRREAIAEIVFRYPVHPTECDANGVKAISLHLDALRPMREKFESLEVDDLDQDEEGAA